jgi:hypothetical protein
LTPSKFHHLLKMLQASLSYTFVPLALISGSSIFSLAFYNRLFILVERLRKFDREIVEECHRQEHQYSRQFIGIVEKQLSVLKIQANIVRFALMSMLASSFFVLCACFFMLENAITAENISNEKTTRGLLYTGLLFEMVGLVLALVELSMSLRTIFGEIKDIHHSISSQNLIANTSGLNP